MDVIFKFISCLQYWRVLINRAERSKLDDFMKATEDWSKCFFNLVNHAYRPVIS